MEEKVILHPVMFSRFVEISEKSFDINNYAEELQQFEELLEEYGRENQHKLSEKDDYFADTEELLESALSLRTNPNSETVTW